jgi:hypothetical protein
MQQLLLLSGSPYRHVMALAVALILAGSGAANATAIGNGVPGPNIGFRFVEVGTQQPADGLQILCCKLYLQSEVTEVSGADNLAIADLTPIDTDGLSYIANGASIDAIASNPGTAYASASRVVAAFPRNTLDTTNVFDIVAFFGINTELSVDDPSRESIFANWTVRLSMQVGPADFGDSEGSASCGFGTVLPEVCPEFENTVARFGPFSLEPGDTFTAFLEMFMSIQAVVQPEPAAVPEPASLTLLAASCIALVAWRRRQRAAPQPPPADQST